MKFLGQFGSFYGSSENYVVDDAPSDQLSLLEESAPGEVGVGASSESYSSIGDILCFKRQYVWFIAGRQL